VWLLVQDLPFGRLSLPVVAKAFQLGLLGGSAARLHFAFCSVRSLLQFDDVPLF
jgi:hypothetical protein